MAENDGMNTPAESLVELARQAALEVVGADALGDFLGTADDSASAVGALTSFHFACLQSGYQGWYWSVSVSTLVGDESPTINDVVLLPGDDAETRARAGAAVIGGLLSSFWVVGDATLAALPREELVRRFGAVLQTAIDG